VLISETHWIWDSWVADDGDAYHLFYLQAPRSLGDAGRRHLNATVGHAVSTDLVSWEVLPEALGPTPGSWDDLSIWTGSTVLGDDGVWRMFYTATSTRGYGVRDQRVGLAESDDLVTWRKIGTSPLLVADPRWYQTLPEDVTASETWRDPQVFRDPDGDGWHMLVTARAREGDLRHRGVVGHAWSADLDAWEVRPPLSAPAVVWRNSLRLVMGSLRRFLVIRGHYRRFRPGEQRKRGQTPRPTFRFERHGGSEGSDPALAWNAMRLRLIAPYENDCDNDRLLPVPS